MLEEARLPLNAMKLVPEPNRFRGTCPVSEEQTRLWGPFAKQVLKGMDGIKPRLCICALACHNKGLFCLPVIQANLVLYQ